MNRFCNFLKKTFRDANLKVWISLSLATLLLGIFFILTSEIKEADSGQVEFIGFVDRYCNQLANLRSPTLNKTAIDITALGSTTVLSILISFGSIIFCFRHLYFRAIHLVISGLGAGLLTYFLKYYFERPRPEELVHLVYVQGFSYPSGHALASAAIYFTIGIIISSYFKSIYKQSIVMGLIIALIILIALSRVFLGVHYFSDVIAGVMLGISWSCTVEATAYLLIKRKKRVYK